MEYPTRYCTRCKCELKVGRSEYYANDEPYCSEWCFKQLQFNKKTLKCFENIFCQTRSCLEVSEVSNLTNSSFSQGAVSF